MGWRLVDERGGSGREETPQKEKRKIDKKRLQKREQRKKEFTG